MPIVVNTLLSKVLNVTSNKEEENDTNDKYWKTIFIASKSCTDTLTGKICTF